MKYTEFIDTMFLGAGEMLSVALILVFAWTMGGVVKTLGTGEYLLSIFRVCTLTTTSNYIYSQLCPSI